MRILAILLASFMAAQARAAAGPAGKPEVKPPTAADAKGEVKPAADVKSAEQSEDAAKGKAESEKAAKKAAKKETAADGMSEDQKVFYTLGAALGKNVSSLGLSANELKYVSMGLKDAALGQKPKVDLGTYIGKVNDMARDRQMAKADEQKKKDQAFIDKAAKAKGAEVSSTGLIYTEVKAGKGKAAKPEDTVKAAYEGRLTDGTVFDASAKHGGPLEFPLNGVIPCWTEGMQKMKVGGKARLVCPSKIAYGDRGQPPVIPGGATLVFDVELVEIVKK
jgi:FKBP-type peptidyl-prolyl cis-trans isomerase FkpA